MQIILADGFSEKELKSYRNIVYRNVYDTFFILITCAQKKEYTFHSKHKNIIQYIMKFDNIDEQFIPKDDIESDLKSLWEDKGILKAMEHKSEIGLEDSAEQ
jgi:hypothetical protein